MNDEGPVTLHSLLGNHPNTTPLISGVVSSPLVNFDFFDVKVANTQFKAIVRDLKYDFGELATVTYLQAKIYDKPYIVLPATIVGRNQHHTIFYNAEHGALSPGDLNGKRVGVRAYTQTTGCWVRGFLAEDYGVDLNSVTWVTFEDPHLAEYDDPATVVRAPEGKTIQQMLIDGEIDAAILGDRSEEGPLKHLIPDHEDAGRAWAAKHGGVPINHLAVIRSSIAEARPDVVREVYCVLKESREASGIATGKEDPLRFGIGAVRQSLEQLSAYALDQKLIPRMLTADELFADAARILGADAN
nr:MAG: phosphate ABC transporter substrate-binding protein [Hyphomicrobiales bacterium]